MFRIEKRDIQFDGRVINDWTPYTSWSNWSSWNASGYGEFQNLEKAMAFETMINKRYNSGENYNATEFRIVAIIDGFRFVKDENVL